MDLSSNAAIIRQRLVNQQIIDPKFKKPSEVIRWLGAVQAQEFAMTKWAIALRLPAIKDSDIQGEFDKGKILRTHLLRPTWHFAVPEDIRWMLAMSAPKLHQGNATMHRKLEIDKKLIIRCNDVLVRELEGGNHFTRTELNSALSKVKIKADGLRLSYLMMQAELERIICSGPRKGKQFTYALLDERAPLKSTFTFDREESIAELTRRYFTSRGPATLKDFTTWSWLSVKEAQKGISVLPKDFVKEKVNGQEYIFKPIDIAKPIEKEATFLMPDYDEYGMGYKDRSAIFNNEKLKIYQAGATTAKAQNPIFNRMIIVDGVIEGTWKRTFEKGKVVVETRTFAPPNKSKQHALDRAVKRFQDFAVSGEA